MVKSPWKREENGSQSPCRIKSSMSMEESKPQSPGEDHFDTTEQHAQLDEGQIKTEPDDDQSVESERDPFDELAELLEEENVPVYLVQMPLVAPPPPSITLPDDCFLFTRRTKVEIASAVPSSSSSVNECLDSPHQRAAGLAPIEVHSQKKSRSRQSDESSDPDRFVAIPQNDCPDSDVFLVSQPKAPQDVDPVRAAVLISILKDAREVEPDSTVFLVSHLYATREVDPDSTVFLVSPQYATREVDLILL
ncbi:GL18102 [Drosophila persimilis]|uniref:GL18102 n=1 Tax=Drosophila persimilis TaxID=7234 RepID=B4HC21_DROPE|nr:GL18102 [Drosophila persimilis]